MKGIDFGIEECELRSGQLDAMRGHVLGNSTAGLRFRNVVVVVFPGSNICKLAGLTTRSHGIYMIAIYVNSSNLYGLFYRCIYARETAVRLFRIEATAMLRVPSRKCWMFGLAPVFTISESGSRFFINETID